MSFIEDQGCACFISAPCSYCMAMVECESCGSFFFSEEQAAGTEVDKIQCIRCEGESHNGFTYD